MQHYNHVRVRRGDALDQRVLDRGQLEVLAIVAFGFLSIAQADKDQNRVLTPAELQRFLLKLGVLLTAQFITAGISPIQFFFTQGVHKWHHPAWVHTAAARALDVRLLRHRADHRHAQSRSKRQ